MSSKEVQRIRCPKCGAEHDFAIWTRINTELDPDLRRFAAENCSERYVRLADSRSMWYTLVCIIR